VPEISASADEMVAAARRWLARQPARQHRTQARGTTLSVRQFQWAMVDAGIIPDEGDYWPSMSTLHAIDRLAAGGRITAEGGDYHDHACRLVLR
jgi:hypothetical protein